MKSNREDKYVFKQTLAMRNSNRTIAQRGEVKLL